MEVKRLWKGNFRELDQGMANFMVHNRFYLVRDMGLLKHARTVGFNPLWLGP